MTVALHIVAACAYCTWLQKAAGQAEKQLESSNFSCKRGVNNHASIIIAKAWVHDGAPEEPPRARGFSGRPSVLLTFGSPAIQMPTGNAGNPMILTNTSLGKECSPSSNSGRTQCCLATHRLHISPHDQLCSCSCYDPSEPTLYNLFTRGLRVEPLSCHVVQCCDVSDMKHRMMLPTLHKLCAKPHRNMASSLTKIQQQLLTTMCAWLQYNLGHASPPHNLMITPQFSTPWFEAA